MTEATKRKFHRPNAKPAQIEPRWLVSLLTQWARHEAATEKHALGYPSKSPGFSEKTTGGYNHTDPTSFHSGDYKDVEKALETCREYRQTYWAALMMYYRPWGIPGLVAHGFPFGNTTYYERLHKAHAYIAELMSAEIVAAA